MKALGRARVRWVAAFALVLFASFSASVWAELPAALESPSAQEAPETTPLPPPLGGDDIRLPDAQEVANGIAQREEMDAGVLERIASPAAAHEREVSQDAYADLSPTESQQLLSSQFSERLEALNSDPARFLSDAELVHPAGESAAVVSAEGKTTLMDSTVPIRVPNEEGDLSKVDLSLLADGSGSFEPANPIVELTIPAAANEGVELGDAGLSVTQVGADEGSTARRFGDKNVFYPEVQQSTDLLVSPTSTGVELFDQLRSEDSPETLRFHLELPAGATLVADEIGGAELTAPSGQPLAHIPPPTAEDAQGTAVPVELHVEGDALVLHVPHPEGDYAAPILVDPEFVFENWYTANWYNGWGLSALSDGTWQWSSNVPWIYPSTTPIHDGFGGSERGLFISTPNGTWGANNYGHWVYSVPDWDSYIDHASLLPYWRADNGCPYTQYPQPHDYDGLWDGSQWIQLHTNDARILGSSNLPQWGKALIIGMDSGGGTQIPCWRDLYVGGVGIWLDDWSQPELHTSSSGQWMDNVPVRLNVSGTDIGLGMRMFEAQATNQAGAVQSWQTWHPCVGTRASRCPETWNLAEAGQPQLSYDPSVLPEGIDTLNVTAYDAVLRRSETTNGMTVRVDHAPPILELSGTITEQATLGTEKPIYTIRASASDGLPESKNPADARSGVVKITFEENGKLVRPADEAACPTQSCGLFQVLEVPAREMSAGAHTLTVKATDALGHVATKELNFTVGDLQAPSLNVTGMPTESSAMPKRASYWSAFGASGTGNGLLKAPADVAIDASGDLWVADKGNNRIEKFNPNGEYLAKFGSAGSGNGQFSSPAAIAIDLKGNIWVADKGNGRIEKFNPNGEYLAKFGSAGSGNGQFTSGGPEGIAIDTKGNIWVSDTYGGRIEKFDESGNFVKAVGSKGSGVGQLGEPTGIDVGPNGNVWVADWQNNRVAVFSEAGEFLTQFGSVGTGNGQFNRPDAIAIGARGDVWVGDQNNRRIEEFDQNGAYLSQFGSPGSGKGQFSFTFPMGVATDSKGSIWIADTNNNRIQRWVDPNTTLNGYVEPIGATATDSGWGVTSLAVKLTDQGGNTETIGQTSQACNEGGCSLTYNLGELELAERPSGPYLLTVAATDAAGNVRRTSRVFSLDSAPPEIALSGPLAESARGPLTTPTSQLEISAKDADPASGGIKTLNVERDGQLVASYPSDCSSDCHEVGASYTFRAAADGADRSIQPAPASGSGSIGELRRLSCVAAQNCWAVGRAQLSFKELAEGKAPEPFLEHWNGTEWLAVSVPKPGGATEVLLEGVACGSSTACTAVGYYNNGAKRPLFERWDGTNWTATTAALPTGYTKGFLEGISCGAASDCWAYGKTQVSLAEEKEGKVPGPFLAHWFGGQWQTTSVPNPEGATSPTLGSVSCPSSSACVAVGRYNNGGTRPLVERWNGTSWTPTAAALPSGRAKGFLESISCSAASDCWAYGRAEVSLLIEEPFFDHWHNGEWQAAPVPKAPDGSSTELRGISCGSEAACTAVGRYSNAQGETLPIAYTWDAGGWRFQPVPAPTEATNSSLEGVSCTAANECGMVGFSTRGTALRQVLAEKEAPGNGSHLITVEAVDVQGNSESETLEVDVPSTPADPPECNTEPASTAPRGVVTPSQAIAVVEEELPAAVAPSQGTIEEMTEEPIDPSYSTPAPNLAAVESLAEAETSVTPEGGVTLDETACITPASLTTAATDGTVVNGDAAVFANTAPETDTVIRPTAMGMAVVQSLRGSGAPDSFSWNVTVAAGEELIELPSGAVAIVDAGSEPSEPPESGLEVPAEPGKTPQVLSDAAAQLEDGEFQLLSASSETPLDVLAVIAQPWVVLSQGGIVPALIEVVPDTESPNEFEVIVRPEEEEEEVEGGEPPDFEPMELVMEMATASSVSGHCRRNESPCGQFDPNRAARYAKYWGNEAHNGGWNSKHYPDFGSNNCTNFLSQVLRAGGMRFMKAYDRGDGSWWYVNLVPEGQLWWNGHEQTQSWVAADLLPRHLWQYGLARIDPTNQPYGWVRGDILAYDWFSEGGHGNFDHSNFVVGRIKPSNGPYEPLFANSSSPGHRYGSKRWSRVKESIEEAHQNEWRRVPLVTKHTTANLDEKHHAPDNLYGPSGVYQGPNP